MMNCDYGHFLMDIVCNCVELLLACFSILFDILFILQHYVFYRHSATIEVSVASSSDPLLLPPTYKENSSETDNSMA